jgi:hypothetical protein
MQISSQLADCGGLSCAEKPIDENTAIPLRELVRLRLPHWPVFYHVHDLQTAIPECSSAAILAESCVSKPG